MATSLTFTSALFVSASQLTSGSQLTPLTIMDQTTNGSRIYGIAVSTTSTTNHQLQLTLHPDPAAPAYVLTTAGVPLRSGATGSIATFDLFGASVGSALFQKQKDANGAPYFNMPPSALLKINSSGSFISTGATASIFVMGELY